MRSRCARGLLGVGLLLVMIAGIVVVWSHSPVQGRTRVVAYFDNSNGIFVGDEVVMLGVKIGEIDAIEPQPHSAKITFWFDDKYKVPADATAVILSPKLITSRAIQLTPTYSGGPVLADGAVIPQSRTTVPVEFDDLRRQLEKLAESLEPTQPDGVSPLGALVNTTADNLRGEGDQIRKMLVQLSQAVSAIGDNGKDAFGTIKNLSILVSALKDSAELMRRLNNNLASVTTLVANDPDEVGQAVSDLNTAVEDVTSFVAENRDALGSASDKLGSITDALVESIDDVKQTLHLLPNGLSNIVNIYEPAHGSVTGALAVNNFSNPINFLCGAIQAASRMSAEQSAKLCVQYLAPIVKNRQYNMLPVGTTLHPLLGLPLVNASVRPNEVTYSEDWMRPDYRPNHPPEPANDPQPSNRRQPATSTDPDQGLLGLMMPTGVGG